MSYNVIDDIKETINQAVSSKAYKVENYFVRDDTLTLSYQIDSSLQSYSVVNGFPTFDLSKSTKPIIVEVGSDSIAISWTKVIAPTPIPPDVIDVIDFKGVYNIQDESIYGETLYGKANTLQLHDFILNEGNVNKYGLPFYDLASSSLTFKIGNAKGVLIGGNALAVGSALYTLTNKDYLTNNHSTYSYYELKAGDMIGYRFPNAGNEFISVIGE